MSNAQFRMQQAEFAEARAKKAAWAQRLLADAEALSPAHAEKIEGIVNDCFTQRGGKGIDLAIQTCEMIMEAGNLSRAYDIRILNENIKRLDEGLEPEKPAFSSPVSAAAHLGAARDHRELSKERATTLQDAKIDAAEHIVHAEQRFIANAEREARKDSVLREAAPRKEAASKPATPEQAKPNAPPKQSATPQVA